MNHSSLLACLQESGFSVWVDADKLIVSPAKKLTPELRKMIRESKPALMELLGGKSDDDKKMDAFIRMLKNRVPGKVVEFVEAELITICDKMEAIETVKWEAFEEFVMTNNEKANERWQRNKQNAEAKA